jgi:hypothetical protein
MNYENDWILPKIKKIIKERQTKIEHISKSIEISNGEFSKILNGERLNYYKHIPAIADYFEIPFLSLVSNENNINSSISYHPDFQLLNNNINQFEAIIKAKEANIKILEVLVINLTESKENYKRKYESCKEKLKLCESK